jgi:serine protease AprX
MKRNTVKAMFILALALGGSISAFAQTPAEKQRRSVVNDSLSAAFTKRNLERKQEAIKMAELKGWPLTIEKDGSFAELMRVSEEGTPIYYKTSNEGSAATSRANRLYPGGTLGLNITGDGVTGGIWDSNHARTNHVTFGNGRADVEDTAGPTSEHATHVAGTMIGQGSAAHPEARGMAYKGELQVNDWTNDTGEMANQAENDDLVVSNHSYGLDASQEFPLYYWGAYLQDSKDVDDVMFNNPRFQSVIAAGNDRGSGVNPSKSGKDLLTTMSTAKNVLTVAAIHEFTDYVSAAESASEVEIASFSNFGPTDDFRIKPDIATKGVNVYSSTDATLTSFASLSGTSMACPGVSGVIMLLQQHYANLHDDGDDETSDWMNSATVRALIAHTADEIGDEDGPDYKTGWGLLNAERAAVTMTKAVESNSDLAIVDQLTLQNDVDYIFDVVSDGVNPLVATIAWTDRSGNINNGTTDLSTPVLKNDLNMRLTSDNTGDVFFPWKLDDSWANPVTITGNNDVDNIEKIEINAPAGTYEVKIYNSGNLIGGSQDYSLVVTGIDQVGGTVTNKLDAFSVWPNPASDILNVRIKSGVADGTEITIFDIQGRQVAYKKMSADNDKINIDYLSAGVYMVKVSQGTKQEVKKIIVK